MTQQRQRLGQPVIKMLACPRMQDGTEIIRRGITARAEPQQRAYRHDAQDTATTDIERENGEQLPTFAHAYETHRAAVVGVMAPEDIRQLPGTEQGIGAALLQQQLP